MKNIKYNKVRVRIADNVCDEKEHTIFELTFKGNDIPRVDRQTIINDGLYGHDFIGMSMIDLCKWQQHDSTGSHPENYHEVYDWRHARYRDFMSALDIRQIVCGECTNYNTGTKEEDVSSVEKE